MKPKLKVRGKEELIEVSVNDIYADQIQKEVIEKWQEVLDLAISMFNVPNALIMRLHEDDLEVFAKSNNQENIFTMNKHAAIGVGHYCETVVGNDEMLMVKDASEDPLWEGNPDLKYGLVNYLGLPIKWPDGKIFGTMCLLDQDANTYNEEQIELFKALKSNIEKDLTLLDRNVQLTKSLDELERTQELLIHHEKNNLTNQLVSNITHEISTPLNVAMTSAAYLDYAAKKMDFSDRDAMNRLKEGTDLVQRNLLHASELLSSFKKIANDQGRMQEENIDLGLYIKSIFLSSKLKLKEHDTTWEVDSPKSLILKTKPGAIAQVLLSLIDNALKHGFKDRKSNEIHVAIKDENEHVIITLKDNGMGYTGDHEEIFKPFMRHEHHEGAGLGLTLVKEIVEQNLQGTILASTNGGMIFDINIPKK